MTDDTMKQAALRLAARFHETYERLAPHYGYETRAETRAFDPESKNGRLMIATCRHLLSDRHAVLVSPSSEELSGVLKRRASYRDGFATRDIDTLLDAVRELVAAVHGIAPWLSASLDERSCDEYVAACEAVFAQDEKHDRGSPS